MNPATTPADTRWVCALALAGLLSALIAAWCGCAPATTFETEPVLSLPRQTGSLVTSRSLPVVSDASADRFERLPASQTGIDFQPYWSPPEKYAEIIDRSFAGGGVAIGDYDRDGLPDIYLTRPFGGGRLYRNQGGFKFSDATEASGLAGDTLWGCGPSFADIDQDGDLDLFVCGYDCPNRLFVNQGNGTFIEQGAQRGLAFVGASVMMSFADYDSDGDLDGFLATERFVSDADSQRLKQQLAEGRKFYEQRGDQVEILPDARELMALFPMPGGKEVKLIQAGQFKKLYRNDGHGKFDEVSQQAGLVDNGLTLSATWWDYNQDGHPDLYLANDFYGSDRLFHNNGDGTFRDVARQVLPQIPWYSMGCNVADVNNDGWLDFMGSDMSGTTHYKSKVAMGDMTKDNWFMDASDPRQVMRNALFVNTGAGRFLETAQMAGVANSDWTWSLKFGDFDSDGRVDLFISNGMTGDWLNSDLLVKAEAEHRDVTRDEVPLKRDRNMAYRNLGDLSFANKAREWGLDEESVGFGAAMGDLDQDGDLDLVVNNFAEPPSVLRNQLKQGNRVMLALRGSQSNSHGLDSLVTIEASDLKLAHYVTLARGFMGSDEPVIHVGLGDRPQIDRLTIRWPSGRVQTLTDLAANHAYTIEEPSGDVLEVAATDASAPTAVSTTRPMFAPSALMDSLLVAHKEREFDDFQREPLLPNKLSQLGPGIALADVDGDGATDIFMGGAAGQAGNLYLRRGAKYVNQRELPGATDPFAEHAACEDMGCLFADFDQDGDKDLYVVSGGVECQPGATLLDDRLYVNNGSGQFTLAPYGTLPRLRDSGSCVVAADVDRDLDLDLFVGGRTVPGAYPSTPQSRLLLNESAAGGTLKFIDATEAAAPELLNTGLVTAALWSDADNDGWIDLLVTHEWGPIKLFHNRQGKLVDVTAAAGMSERLGWWNGIAGADVDGDGDMDYAVTNFGLNTKYHPTPENPVAIFYGDFGQQGQRQIVEAKKHGDHFLPVRGKSCSQLAMPFLREKFPTYHDFAIADLTDIYSSAALDTALRVEANQLESGIWLNDGQGKFRFESLPRLAQIAPAFGVQFADVDSDGKVDLYLAQNFYHPQRETGPMNGGVSLLLQGQGDGSFVPVEPRVSGLMVPEDAKSLSATDMNGDALLDFVIGVNHDRLQVLENRAASGRALQVVLQAPRADHLLAGARVTVTLDDGSRQTAELYFGESYLTQSVASPTFGLADRHATHVHVRWSDGTESEHDVTEKEVNRIEMRR